MQHTQHPKYSSFDFEFSSAFSGVPAESFSGVRLPYYTGRDDLRILIVLDYMPTEDLRSGKLLSGVTRDNLNNIIQLAQRIFVRKEVDPSWMACTYNAYRTAGKPQQYQQQAREEFTRRLNQLIKRYRPDVVLGFGRQVMQALIPYQIGLTEGTWTSWLGVPIECTTESTHVYKFVGSLSLNPLSDARSSDASLIGYMARNVANALANRHLFNINDKRIKAHRSVLIDTIPKFDKLMAMIRSYPIIAIDTEANNLNRVVNKLLTIQFAKCPNFGYLLPIYHKDTPFDAGELKYITTQLRLFFEGRNKNEYHIYVNAQFDLNLMRGQLGIRYYANRVWDCLGAEYCFHPDTLVDTERGKLPIRQLVNMENPPLALSFNHATGKTEYKPIDIRVEHTTNEEMYEIEYEGGTLRITGNDKIWSVTRNSYVRVDEIEVGEEVLVRT